MTKLYIHCNFKDLPKWIPIVWFCVDCNKLGDRIRKYNLRWRFHKNRKLYRHSNRKNEKSWVHVGWFNCFTNKVELN